MTERRLLLGNEAIARGLVENGCAVATSYPGTPASEILAAVAFFQKENKISMHTQSFKTPVMLRPTTRVCHSRQDIVLGEIPQNHREVKFEKDPARWAATPKFRFRLHQELEEKLAGIARHGATAPVRLNPEVEEKKAIVSSGVAAAHTREIMQELGLWQKIPLYQVLQPFPLHSDFVSHLGASYDDILVIEETTGVIEMQLADRYHVKGKLSHAVPRVGELSPEKIEEILCRFGDIEFDKFELPAVAGRRPTLCAGCPHRASFFAIKKAAPKGIYTSDIGCGVCLNVCPKGFLADQRKAIKIYPQRPSRLRGTITEFQICLDRT